MFKLDKSFILFVVLATIVILLPDSAWAQFTGLKTSGTNIFVGLRSIIYPASAIGVICVCIGGFFGNINWKWLMAIVVGLIVIASCSGFIQLFADGVDVNLNGE
ncbi:MAG: hypothetical protein E7005_05790 [Alphaproteobacteria bacterium]|nr:hypothetical protein [Alphaproteobacteria bacterium]